MNYIPHVHSATLPLMHDSEKLLQDIMLSGEAFTFAYYLAYTFAMQ